MNDNLVSMKDAAEYLGYSVDGLREIVDRSRRRANGSAVRGPFIKFFQAGSDDPAFFRWFSVANYQPQTPRFRPTEHASRLSGPLPRA